MIPKRYRPAIVANLTTALASGSPLASSAHSNAADSWRRMADRDTVAAFPRPASPMTSSPGAPRPW
ncbi:hypothetical protein [Streptomyces sp. NPDC003032]